MKEFLGKSSIICPNNDGHRLSLNFWYVLCFFPLKVQGRSLCKICHGIVTEKMQSQQDWDRSDFLKSGVTVALV